MWHFSVVHYYYFMLRNRYYLLFYVSFFRHMLLGYLFHVGIWILVTLVYNSLSLNL
jgi:hypothetical protein